MFDVVIPHARKSKWRSISLKYALRSLDKFAQGVGRVIVVGARPEWLAPTAIFIEQGDPGHRHPNVCQKVYTGLSRVTTERFVIMTDDYFLCAPVDFTKYPNYSRKNLDHKYKEPNPASFYHTVLHNTYKHLNTQGLPTKDFDGHAPVCLSTNLCFQTVGHWVGQSKTGVTDKDMSISSLTLNMELCPGEHRIDIKLNSDYTKEMFLEAISKTFCFSTGRGFDPHWWLEANLTKKSKWEK